MLNPEVVPFINECKEEVIRSSRTKLLCGSYFEMIKKLDASNRNGLNNLDDFNKAMSVYNQVPIDEFCTKFLGYIPKDDPTQYPESNKLFTYASKLCQSLCSDDTDIENVVVKPICRVLASGFQLSDMKSPVQQIVSPLNNAANNQDKVEVVEKNRENAKQIPQPKSGNAQPEITSKNAAASIDNVKQGQDPSMLEAHSNANDGAKSGVDDTEPKENSSPNAEPIQVNEGIVKGSGLGNEDNESKSIATTNVVSEKKVPTIKSDTKANQKVTSSSLNPVDIEQPANVQQPILDSNSANDDESMKEEYDRVNSKSSVTDVNENLEDSDITNKDKLVNINDDDSNEDDIDKNDDEDIDPLQGNQASDQSHSQSPNQSPSKEQLQNEDPFINDKDSNFFNYFMFLLLVCVVAYVVYHNKSKMLALMLEGRRSSTSGRSGVSRRKHTAAYRKLDSNLEEAITSSGNGRSTQVIY